MDVQVEVLNILERVLNLGGRTSAFGPDSALLGSVPELDSMAVATVIATLEEHFDFVIEDDEIEGSTFATVGSLVDFVKGKLAA